MQASLTNKDFGLVEHWLKNIRDVARLHNSELETIKDQDVSMDHVQ